MKMKIIGLILIVCFASSSYGQKVASSDFFKVPKECTIRYSSGALQGTKHSIDSIGYLCFANIYCKKTYEIIFLYRDLAIRKAIGYDVSDIFMNKQLGSNNFTDFECYVFVYPQRDPERQADIGASNIDFPVKVVAYRRYWDNKVVANENHYKFKFVSERKVDNFEQLSEFQFKVIYNLITVNSN